MASNNRIKKHQQEHQEERKLRFALKMLQFTGHKSLYQ